MKIQNLRFKGEKLLVGNELVEFDANGIAFLDDEIGEGLLSLPNFIQIKEEVIEDEVKTDEVEEQKEDSQNDESVESANEEVEETKDYSKLNVADLKALLKEKDIAYPKNAKKEELLELLN